jgi:hypothetical protein
MDGYDDLPPSEVARDKRRDRDAESQKRAGMRSGLAKQFKQVLDAQVKRARADETDTDDARLPETDGRPPAPRRKR